MHLARRITSLWSACLCRQELVRLQKWVPLNNLKMAKNYTRMKSSRVKSFRKKPLKWRRVVVASTVRESAKVWKFGRVYFKLIVFQIDHFSLKSADSYLRDSYCSPRFFQNLPASAKHYVVFDVFADFQSLFQPENLGSHKNGALVHRWQISTARSTNSPKNSSSATHAYHPRLFLTFYLPIVTRELPGFHL